MKIAGRTFFVGAAMLALAACETAPPQQQMTAVRAAPPPPQQAQQEEMVWVRMDGQRGAGNPQLERQYQDDSSFCLGGGRSMQEARECMRERGYDHVPVSQAEATRQRYAQQAGPG